MNKMNKVENFTSTGNKLINHPEVLCNLKKNKATPISIQIAPTSTCNLNCIFCSNKQRDNKNESLELNDVLHFLSKMKSLGAKTVEWTGGGDPSLYYYINEVIAYAATLGYEQGLISNGAQLKEKIELQNLNRLKWLRISMNCLDYVKGIDLPKIDGTLGFSYVMNDNTNHETLTRLDKYVVGLKPSYVRIVPNCQATKEEQEENNRRLSALVKTWMHPYFYQEKTFEKPDKCYWGYFKPFLLHNGWVYPCSSIVLNDDAEKQFHDKYKWIHMCKVQELYENTIEPFSTDLCNHCVFCSQNNMVENILHPSDMGNFI